MLNVLLLLAAIPLAVTLHDLLRRRDISRQAIRNISRHRGEAILVLAGTLLGTAIITASFVVGDSLEGSIRDLAVTELGEVDESVVVSGRNAGPALLAIETAGLADVDGILMIEAAPAAVVSESETPRGEPRATVVGLDLEQARQFGSDPESTGFSTAAIPGPGQALINSEVANTLGVESGDMITAHLMGGTLHLTVIEVIEPIGLAGRWSPVFVDPEALRVLGAGSGQSPRTEILISNAGGVFSGAELTDSVTAQLRDLTAGFGSDVTPLKADLLADADEEGAELTTLFAGIGSFAVIAGILLLINLFNMLAEERRTDLGVQRALGARRNVVTRQLGMEGTMYAAVAAVLGSVVGLGVGWLIMQFARSLLEDDGLTMSFTTNWSSLILGATVGLVISLATVWFTSVRIARLNIIRAIRQLPEPASLSSRRRGMAVAVLGGAGGLALFALGLSGPNDLAVIAGLPIAAFATIGLTRSKTTRKVVVTVASIVSMAWGVLVFTLLPDATADSGISGFVVQGLVLVSGAIALVTTHDRVWARILPDTVAVRLGLANPLARRFRTGLVVSMYSLVIFMIMFMAVFAAVFTRQADQLAAGVSAGHDLYVDSSAGNPLTEEQLSSVAGVESVSVIDRGWAEFSGEWSDARWGSWVAGVEPDLFATEGFDVIDRDSSYGTDLEALNAIFTDPSAIVVPEFFLVDGDGPGGNRAQAGDEVVVVHSGTGRTRTYTVAAVTASDWIFTGPLVSSNTLRDLASRQTEATRAYVRLTSPELAEDIAATIDAMFLTNGANSTSFVAEVKSELAETDGFIRILSGYLGLGLVIGIAGLGVVMIRAVRERRREIGMLRAMGLPAATVRSAFLVEAGFIGFLGASIGTGLGLLTGYQVVTNSSLFGDIDVSYVTPWTMVLIVFVGPLAASLVAAAVPASRAASIRPAAALRITS